MDTPTSGVEENVQAEAIRRGHALAYRVRGSGVPVVFIQGVGLHGDGWLPQVEGLKEQCRCLTFDNRGVRTNPGAGKPPKELPFGAPITVEQMAEDTLAVMDAAGDPWQSAHVVGHSLGGLVALEMALRARPRIKSLTLMCTFADGRVATRLTPRMLWLGMRSRIGPRAWRRRAFLEIVMPPEEIKRLDSAAWAKRLEPLFGHDLADFSSVVSHQLNALKKYDATARLKELAGLPTLVLSARHDPIARPDEAGRALLDGIPGAKYVEFEHASHGLPIQCPADVNALLMDHFGHAQRSADLTASSPTAAPAPSPYTSAEK